MAPRTFMQFLCLALLCLNLAARAGETYTPPELDNWRPWVLSQHPELDCPQRADATRLCHWPSSLALSLNDKGAQFILEASLYRESHLTLPGDDQHWPDKVTANGKPVTVTRAHGQPRILLPVGQHLIRGEFTWAAAPRTLAIPTDTALITPTDVTGSQIPVKLENGRLVLQQTPRSTNTQSPQSLDIKVFRLASDGTPFELTTSIDLHVSGQEREITLPNTLPAGFQLRSLESPLPARMDTAGNLRVLLRPGRWQVTSHAYTLAPPAALGFTRSSTDWPEQEIWSFVSAPQLRSVELTGAAAIDPAQTQMPGQWQGHPAYLLTPDTQLSVRELHRVTGDKSHSLTLTKHLWLDFSGEAFTVEDRARGELGPHARLTTHPQVELGSASNQGSPLVVTRLPGAEAAGIELRSSELDLLARARLERSAHLPASGWQTSFQSLDTWVHLPPGWSLLAATGADTLSGVWLDAFNLWDIFLILLIAVTLGRAGSPLLGLFALAVIVLIYQRTNAPLLIWLNLGVCLALGRFVSERWRQWLEYYTLASFAILALILLPYITDQARLAVYPQLEHYNTQQYEKKSGGEAESLRISDISMPEYEADAEVRRSMSNAKVNAPAPARVNTDYDPEQKVQAGPAPMDWHWNRAQLSWSGPVDPSQSTRLILVGPLLDRIGHLLAILGPVLLGMLLLKRAPLPSQARRRLPGVAALVLAALCMPDKSVQAQVLIDQSLLSELEQRLLRPAPCLPECAAIASAALRVDHQRLALTLELHAEQFVALPLPAQQNQWWPHQVRLNGKAAILGRSEGGELLLALPAGRHTLELEASVEPLQQVDLNFALPAHNIETQLQGWRLTSRTSEKQHLQLNREGAQAGAKTETQLPPSDIQPLVRVERHLNFGLDWTMTTRVVRLAPTDQSLSVAITLLPGETPLTDLKYSDRALPVYLAPQASSFSWQSSLDEVSSLTLSAPEADARYYSVWSLQASPVWHLSTESAATKVVSAQQVRWLPRPGDELRIEVSRPAALPGDTLVITRSELLQHLGERQQTTTLTLGIETHQGGQFEFTLPEAAELTALSIDGRELPPGKTSGAIRVPINANTQSLTLNWRAPSTLTALTRSEPVALGYPAANNTVQLNLPQDRWVLATGGPQIGPAVLLWGVLIVVLILAVGLARTQLTPLRTWEWIVLSLGVITFNAFVLMLLASWFIAMTLRGRTSAVRLGAYFNPLQIGLMVFGLLALAATASTIPHGLLAQPEMLVTGNGSHAHQLIWYSDRATGALPTAWVVSLPMWSYRLTMLLWSLWLAFALTRWLPWAWRQLNHTGFWHSVRPGKPATDESLELELPPDEPTESKERR
ncbi:hypothetical protein [Gilvimarinus algae]|uniref:Uncharacterized protein n=1 Tax=Gilvimarinus algae TaxID=3058037 RepID=A0ABT8TEM1_9GAMM|nr:hypothetical protein [Gilvimarinus sp. SDUM040014]MDO3382075.1 hypothetical protein [Gilvimarinus sp. SDUM040014]